MASITSRKRDKGGTAHMAQIVIKRKGKIVYRENKTFDRKQDAYAWAAAREAELKAPGGLDKVKNGSKTLGDAIRMYKETVQPKGTKSYVLDRLLTYDIAERACENIGSADLVNLMKTMRKTVAPQSVAHYVSHLSPVFKLAKPAWGYPLDKHAFEDAREVGRQLGYLAQSNKRDRRPTLDELDKLMQFFYDRSTRYTDCVPMHKVIAFAVFSTRRISEIVRILHTDFDKDRVLVRDMKHPGQKKGNNVWCNLPIEAVQIVQGMPKVQPEIFPYTVAAISKAFTEACGVLGIEGLHFHDLRHEGVSRLFELGWNIPNVATVSGHQSWTNLKRYSHIRQQGDKYAGWKWLPIVTEGAANDNATRAERMTA